MKNVRFTKKFNYFRKGIKSDIGISKENTRDCRGLLNTSC